jgi:hypothetical protein
MRGPIFRAFFEDLFQGDPVALVVGGVILAIIAIIGLFWWKTARDLRREDEERKNRYRRAGEKKL